MYKIDMLQLKPWSSPEPHLETIFTSMTPSCTPFPEQIVSASPQAHTCAQAGPSTWNALTLIHSPPLAYRSSTGL